MFAASVSNLEANGFGFSKLDSGAESGAHLVSQIAD
jgi:hypothetical protein